MDVCMSYLGSADQVTALRVQALGAVNGLTIYVPPAHTRRSSGPVLDPEAVLKLTQADVVLGLVSSEFSEACREELELGRGNSKPMIVMADSQIARQLLPSF